MRARPLLITAVATALLSVVPVTANAATHREYLDRSTFDSTVEQTAATYRIAGATSGELGGYFDVTVTAKDGSLPVGSQVCEPARIDAVLTIAPGETLTIHARAELCTSFYGDKLVATAAVSNRNVDYDGTHRQFRVVREALLTAAFTSWFGGQAAFNGDIRW